MTKEPIVWTNVLSPEKRGERMVTLHDGREVSNYSREWMLECEARAVARLPTKGLRHTYILHVRVGNGKHKGRGDAAANELEQLATILFKKMRQEARELQEWCG